MLRYPKEYEEALSRLNAPERSPLPYAPIPYGPTPNYCNYMNWNRIMAETRQGVLPKYSILQRIDLGSQNDLVMVSDAKEYTYTLDPSFTFAKGARKSIAVRAVDIYNVIPNGQSKIATETFKNEIEITFDNNTVNPAVQGIQLTFSIGATSFELSNDLQISMTNFAEAFGKSVIATLNAATGYDAIFADYLATYDSNNRKISVTFFTIAGYEITNIEAQWAADPLHHFVYWDVENSSMSDYYNLNMNEMEYGRKTITGGSTPSTFTLEFNIPDSTLDVRQSVVCGSINPWTKNNLIAPLTYSSDTLTKVFPYNGCTEVRFWFVNRIGEKVRWRSVRGYIDLELIIDNSDSYAMTGDT